MDGMDGIGMDGIGMDGIGMDGRYIYKIVY